MITPEDIRQQAGLTGEQLLRSQKAMQQDELSYLSGLAFEQFEVGKEELDSLNRRIDKRAGGKGSSLQAILISLFCGLFIGISVFFVLFHKSKTHPSVFQAIEPDKPKEPMNSVSTADTVFPEVVQASPKKEEHYSSTLNQAQEPAPLMESPEPMSSKTVGLPETAPAAEEDIILTFSPNAPVVFISNLKVTNYRLYYFRQNESIDLSVNTGLAAQYESKAHVENIYINRSEGYLAHKIIQRAMKLFSAKHYTNCIEELSMLYEFNKGDANAQFYLGMCYYLTGKYSTAQVFFQKNLDNENNIFHQESDFYQAMCFLQTKQSDKALAQLQSIVNAKGFYSARAQEVISRQK
jgi:TolA-binding protein